MNADFSKYVYKATLMEKSINEDANQLLEDLGKEMVLELNSSIAMAEYDGDKGGCHGDYKLEDRVLTLGAYGHPITFMEFGTGITYRSDKHPLARRNNMQIGSASKGFLWGRGHWNDKAGWWFPSSKGFQHTMGNRANKIVFNCIEYAKRQLHFSLMTGRYFDYDKH